MREDLAGLKYQLYIMRQNEARDWSDKQARYHFVIVNPEKGKDYPMNFVCTLPLRLNSNFKTSFEQRFRGESLEIAKQLLNKVLQSETDGEVRTEVERRLKMLSPETVRTRICAFCGRTFQAETKKRFRQKYYEDCVREKFGSRTQ